MFRHTHSPSAEIGADHERSADEACEAIHIPANAEQARVAKAYIAQLNQARVYDAAIVTKIEPGREFYAAEDYHQDYMTLHPTQPYIVYNDLPKVDDLKTMFPDLYRADPVLVTVRASN